MRHADIEVAIERPQLALRDVGFCYPGGRWAVRALNLVFEPGIWGLLGPNGAGKSTLMRMLATLTRPSAGQVLWNGEDVTREPDRLRRQLGYLPQDFGVYPSLSAREFLRYLGALKDLPRRALDERIETCLAQVGLTEAADQRLGGYSGGMRQRVGIAQALLNDPQLLIVDEPTVGLDPSERLRFRQLLTELGGQRVVILCTHIVADVEASATRIAVVRQGQLRFAGPPPQLLEAVQGQVWECLVPLDQVEALRTRGIVTASQLDVQGVRVRLVAPQAPTADARPVAPTLEDAYMEMVK